jgi:hypothetical protein
LKDFDQYIQTFDKSKFENEHLFGLWHGLKVGQAIARGNNPAEIEMPEFPDKWDYEKRTDGELDD